MAALSANKANLNFFFIQNFFLCRSFLSHQMIIDIQSPNNLATEGSPVRTSKANFFKYNSLNTKITKTNIDGINCNNKK